MARGKAVEIEFDEAQAVVEWQAVVDAATEAETQEGGNGARVTRLAHPAPAVALWHGTYGCAPCEPGEPAVTLSDGRVIALQGAENEL